jgi:hypothetical protein
MEPVTTIDPSEGGTLPGVPAATATDTGRGRARLVGAVVGAVAGLLAIAALTIVARLTGLGEWVGLALLVGEDGVFSLESGAPFAWVVPPLAAGIVGALTAPGAARGVRWSGWWMGFLTYGLGIVIGAVLLVLVPTGVMDASSEFPADPISLVVGGLVLTFVGAIIAAPVLALCVAAGVAWAAIVRRLAPLRAGTDPGARPIVVLGVVAAILAVLWLMVTTFLDILVQSQVE